MPWYCGGHIMSCVFYSQNSYLSNCFKKRNSNISFSIAQKMRIDHFQINTHYRFLNKLLIHRKLQIFIWPQNWNCLTDKLKVFYASLFYFGWNLLTKNEFKMSIGHLKPMLISETLCAFRYSCFHNLFQNNRLIWF